MDTLKKTEQEKAGLFGIYAWKDKMDDYYLTDSIMFHEHSSVVARSYLAAFQQDRKLQFKRYELHRLGYFDPHSGLITSLSSPEKLNPLEVWSEKPFNPDEIQEL